MKQLNCGIDNIPGQGADHRKNITFEITEDQMKYIVDKVHDVTSAMQSEVKNEDFEIDFIVKAMKKNFKENKIVSQEQTITNGFSLILGSRSASVSTKTAGLWRGICPAS